MLLNERVLADRCNVFTCRQTDRQTDRQTVNYCRLLNDALAFIPAACLTVLNSWTLADLLQCMDLDSSFYRAMHNSAKRGIAIACRLSVRPSVTLVDQKDRIGWKSRKLIARTISPTPSLFVAQRPSTYFHGNMGKFWGD